jgi:hypothetical protein
MNEEPMSRAASSIYCPAGIYILSIRPLKRNGYGTSTSQGNTSTGQIILADYPMLSTMHLISAIHKALHYVADSKSTITISIVPFFFWRRPKYCHHEHNSTMRALNCSIISKPSAARFDEGIRLQIKTGQSTAGCSGI